MDDKWEAANDVWNRTYDISLLPSKEAVGRLYADDETSAQTWRVVAKSSD